MQACSLRWSVTNRGGGVGKLPYIPNRDHGNWDKNHDDFYFMQMSLVMSMRFIFGDD